MNRYEFMDYVSDVEREPDAVAYVHWRGRPWTNRFPNGYVEGTKLWLDANNKIHRVGAPAVVYPDGTKLWFRHGRPFRHGGEAFENVKIRKFDADEYWT